MFFLLLLLDWITPDDDNAAIMAALPIIAKKVQHII